MIDNDGLGFNVTHKRYKSSEYAASILERFNLTESEKYALGDLVAHSGWSKEYNGGLVDRKIAVDETEDTKFDPSLDTKRNAQKVAVNTRFGTLKLSKLIEDVINPDNNVDIKEIEQMQKQVYQNMQVVNSVTAKDLEPYWETQIIDGVECQVIDLRKNERKKIFRRVQLGGKGKEDLDGNRRKVPHCFQNLSRPFRADYLQRRCPSDNGQSGAVAAAQTERGRCGKACAVRGA